MRTARAHRFASCREEEPAVSVPITFLVLWLAGLLSLALLGGGACLAWAWSVGEVVDTARLLVG
jgi:hypothetical protein